MNLVKSYKGVALAALVVALGGCNDTAKDGAATAESYPLDTQQKKVSYLLGRDVAAQWTARGVALDPQAVALAVRDSLADNDPRLSEQEIKTVIEAFQQEIALKQQQAQSRQNAEFEKQARQNLEAGQTFLAENAGKEGVVTLDSGLQYRVITEGSGPVPGATDNVDVHYRGTLLDGTEFDSSLKRGVPATFGVNQVIPGWTEALQLMKQGAKWQLFIPAELAYGPGGSGTIGPNSTLLFEVELLAVKRPGEQPQGEADDRAEGLYCGPGDAAAGCLRTDRRGGRQGRPGQPREQGQLPDGL